MAGQYNLHSRLKEPLTGGGSMGRRLDPCREEEGLISRTPSQFMQRKFYKIHGLLACVHPPTVLLALGFFNQVPPMLAIRLLYPDRRYPLRCNIAVPRSMENPTHRQDDIRLVMTVLEKGRIL